jgi:hypothetical protein
MRLSLNDVTAIGEDLNDFVTTVYKDYN